MIRKRIGAKQREMLLKLEFLGPIQWADLDQPGRRGATSLNMQGLVRIVRAKGSDISLGNPPVRVEFINPQ